ncbi:50S ribosomal protein L17 [Boudabousia marimammalium]|uniref:50S ribosomal protein L17 n=1 Tax=Boudabousia marimammalium TaxID=156892 RepID=A0A1Q5PJI9_9ACTO|nr:50S ribosomal protein L17 [Boudabousia marimammalium]OKL46046.1 50S ribosomal protein L17 [Boudabousia marimammalium]
MPKPAKGPRLGGSAAHERRMLANLCRSVIEHREITTTFARAKRVQPHLERLITKAKRGDMHARRQVIAVLGTNTAKRDGRFDYTYELFDVIVPAMDSEREGGYTRIVKLPPRKGDQAPMARLSLVMEKVEKKAVVKTAEKTAEAAAEKAPKAEKVEEPAVEEAQVEETATEEEK